MVISIGMEHLYLVTLLFMCLNRLTMTVIYVQGGKIWLDSACQVLFLH